MATPLPFASRITGTGSGFPEREVTNSEMVEILAKDGIETSDEWISERTGIKSRRICDLTNEAERNSSLGLKAALQAMEMAGKKPEDIDQILYATCTPDTLIPTTGCWLQHKLGATNAWAIDLNAACSGFVFALSAADQYIRTGNVKTSLIVGADVLSPFANWKDRGSVILFGDGAGAAIVEQVPSDSPSRVLSNHLHSDGSLWELFQMRAGGSNMEVTYEAIDKGYNKMEMKGREIFKVAVRQLAGYSIKALEANGLTKEDLKWIIPHQANLRIIEAVARKLKVPMDKVLVNIDRYGNTSSATVPTALDEAVRNGKITEGDHLLFTVFGAGLTYGSSLIRW